MSKYITSLELWKSLGSDAFTKVRSETTTTTSDNTIFDFAQQNLISGSETIYVGGAAVSTGFTMNYDDGKIDFASAPAAVPTGDYLYTGIEDSAVQKTLLSSDEELEKVVGQSFSLATTSETIDVEQLQTVFFLERAPVNAIVSLSSNTSSTVTDSPSYLTLTQGLGNDYLFDAPSGRVEIIDNFPVYGQQRLKVSYSHGYTFANMPDLVKELNRLIAVRMMVQNNNFKAILKGRDNFNQASLEQINTRISTIAALLRVNKYERI